MEPWMAWLFLIMALLSMQTTWQSNVIKLRIRRLDYKLTLILKQMNISVQDALALPERAKEAALDPTRKIEAIKIYRDETGSSLSEAKEAVEAWIEGIPKK